MLIVPLIIFAVLVALGLLEAVLHRHNLSKIPIRIHVNGTRGKSSVTRLIRDTGSRLDRRGLDLYGRLFADPGHVAGALKMMANWMSLIPEGSDSRRWNYSPPMNWNWSGPSLL